ncbi:J domain-containing protein [Picosynechococcus sp. PCC 11901]|uniref:J domain-containing protein n=1 Tax=Picosynechococcus sp. PCC 11901 TaxID=2579791 RepID=UPI0010FC2ACF|nr:J domain-containing protein [Picosynechococcus sp. PCC 11901]QCS48419.1 J domain-containing protein [Picosynechococcus sp. PCC 11901]
MNLLECYKILGLRVDAELEAVKAAYRRLARQCHPDVNRGDRQAEYKFIQITQAYKVLAEIHRSPDKQTWLPSPEPQQPTGRAILSPLDQRLKWQSYQRLQDCLQQQRYARAIALMEGLAQRLPQDLEVRQWQGITYLSWGRHLLQQGQNHKARTYLHKALLADPHNRKLRQRVEELLQTILIPAI